VYGDSVYFALAAQYPLKSV